MVYKLLERVQMLKHEVEALLKIELDKKFTIRLWPVRLNKATMVYPTRFDWEYRYTRYWVGELDIDGGALFTTRNYNITNHKAATELYRTYLLCK